MNRDSRTALVLCASLSVALAGCSQKNDPTTELEKASAALQQTERAQAPPPPSSQSGQPVSLPAGTPAPAPAPVQQLNQAMASYKAGKLEDAVTRLQKLRASSAITPQQRMALNDAMAAVMTEIYALAAKGDARAQQAVKQYEQMQTSRPAQ